MSLDSLKKQASRLAAYLGAKHRVNIKHASALEAIAAVHGARNWQTLAAGHESANADTDEAPEPGQPHRLALSWLANGQPHLELPFRKWSYHAFAYGRPRDSAGWLLGHMRLCADLGIGGLFFDVGGAVLEMPDLLIEDLGALVLDLRSVQECAQTGHTPGLSPLVLQRPLNLLAGFQASELAHFKELEREAGVQGFFLEEGIASNSLLDLMTGARIVVVRLPAAGPTAALWARFWVVALRAMGSMAIERTRASHSAGFYAGKRNPLPTAVIGLPDVQRFASLQLGQLAMQASSVGFVFRFVSYQESLNDTSANVGMSTLRMNSFHRLYLGNRKDLAREDILQRLEDAPAVILSPDSCSF